MLVAFNVESSQSVLYNIYTSFFKLAGVCGSSCSQILLMQRYNSQGKELPNSCIENDQKIRSVLSNSVFIRVLCILVFSVGCVYNAMCLEFGTWFCIDGEM